MHLPRAYERMQIIILIIIFVAYLYYCAASTGAVTAAARDYVSRNSLVCSIRWLCSVEMALRSPQDIE